MLFRLIGFDSFLHRVENEGADISYPFSTSEMSKIVLSSTLLLVHNFAPRLTN